MALGVLVIINTFLIILTIVLQVLLYKNKTGNKVIVINMLFSLILSYLAFTALPTNFTMQRILAITMGLVAISAVFIKFKNEKVTLPIKIMLSFSILINLILLLL